MCPVTTNPISPRSGDTMNTSIWFEPFGEYETWEEAVDAVAELFDQRRGTTWGKIVKSDGRVVWVVKGSIDPIR